MTRLQWITTAAAIIIAVTLAAALERYATSRIHAHLQEQAQ